MWNKSQTQVQPAYPIVPEATQHTTSLLKAQLGASFMLIAFWKQNYCCQHWKEVFIWNLKIQRRTRKSYSTPIRCITCIHQKWWRNSKILRILDTANHSSQLGAKREQRWVLFSASPQWFQGIQMDCRSGTKQQPSKALHSALTQRHFLLFCFWILLLKFLKLAEWAI